VGTLGMLWILPGTRQVGSVGFDVNTLLYAAAAVFIGFQSVNFAVFTKIYAVNEGLLPEDPRLNQVFRYVRLELGILVGAGLVALGLIGSLWAISDWRARSFGALNPQQTLRLVVPAVLALILGFQTVLSSFFLSVLGLSRRRR